MGQGSGIWEKEEEGQSSTDTENNRLFASCPTSEEWCLNREGADRRAVMREGLGPRGRVRRTTDGPHNSGRGPSVPSKISPFIWYCYL